MSIASEKIRRKIAENQRLRYTIERCDKTGLCAVCGVNNRYEITPGVYAMTCERRQCKRAWVLFEPYRCEFCKSLDFYCIPFHYDEKGRKLYHCNTCNKTYAVQHRVVIETVADAERELLEKEE